MRSDLYWIDGPWSGKLAVAARPRGGDWLSDDVAGWKRSGISTVLSLLTPSEERDLGLQEEASEIRTQGMRFASFPIPDLQVPNSESELTAVLQDLERDLNLGRNALVHCRQGIGRSGLVAACLLVADGLSSAAAVRKVTEARGRDVPETKEQRQWIDHYAAVLPGIK